MISEIVKVVEIHEARIREALVHINKYLPFTTAMVTDMPEEHMLWIELLVSRFGKLQDLLGAKLFNDVLEKNAENSHGMSMLDKLNSLEKMHIIAKADVWIEMRNARNHVAHEYPNSPELTVKYLNQILNLTPELLTISDNIKNFLLKKTGTADK